MHAVTGRVRNILTRWAFIAIGISAGWIGAFGQAPDADFTSTVASGCSPLTVTFTDISSNSPDTWLWDFGNMNGSTFENPSAVYTDPGTYTVTLTASNSSGSDTETKVAYITVFQNPTANFIADTGMGCIPFSVNYTDLSTPGSAPIISWNWDLGDGNSSIAVNSSHTYTTPGINNISLIIIDTNGCENTKLISAYVIVSSNPIANLSGTPLIQCEIPATVNFSDISTPGSNPIEFWQWNFGDASPLGTTQNPGHQYNAFGLFDLTLTVADSIGCSNTITLTNYIEVVDFQADFQIDTVSNCPNFVLSFIDLSSPGPISWTWDFGDGNGSSVQDPIYSYDSAGTYTITLISTSTDGCVDTITQSIDYYKPKASFTLDTLKSCELPFTVTFTNASTGTAPLIYSWDFGDGSALDTTTNPVHAYTDTGFFDVTLVVTDGLGCNDILMLSDLGDTIVVFDPYAVFDFTPDLGGCIPLTVSFTDLSTSAISNIINWSWNFDDPLSGGNNTSTLQNPTHIFDSIGLYNVWLVVETDWGCKDSITQEVPTGVSPIVVDFTMSDTIACHGEQVNFTDISFDSINTWIWTFGDSTGSSEQNPSHQFQDTGLLVVTLIAGYNGCFDTAYHNIYIKPPKPIFSLTPAIGCTVPHEVTFTDASKGAETWFWDFGDGFTSTDTNVVHTYTAPGIYIIKLEVTNSNGCLDSVFSAVVIPEINSDFTISDTVGCYILPTQLINTTTFAYTPQIDNTIIYFGDGGISNISSALPSNPGGYTYNDTGSFTVTMITTDVYGCKDTLIKPDYIRVHGSFANFTSNISNGCAPLSVNFFDSTITTSNVVSWSWNFGDGSPNSSLQNPVHVYDSVGVYNVLLSVTDSAGCSNTIQYSNYIETKRPSPKFGYKQNVCINEDIAISDSSSGEAISYFWDFGNGDTSTFANPIHSYIDTGIYLVSLTVTDSNGCDSTLINTVNVSAITVAAFGVDTLKAECPPLVVTCLDSSASDVVSWFWDFGDGATSSVQNPVHTYSYPDTFDISLAVTNINGCVDTLLKQQLIKIGGPFGSFDFYPDSGCVPLDVTLIADAYRTETYTWDFGDGVLDSTTGDSVMHTYLSAGTPHPILILKDTNNCEYVAIPPDPDSILIDDPEASFSMSNDTLYSTLCGLDTVFFTDSSFTRSIYTSVTSWFWDFGDFTTSSQQYPYHVYMDTGIYTVTLTAANSIGCFFTSSQTVTVLLDSLNKLKAGIIGYKDVSCNGGNDGEAYSMASSGTLPYSFLWNDSSSQANDTAYFLLAGAYTVLVTDSFGCTDSISVTISEPTPLLIDIIDSAMISCNGADDGEAVVEGTGGSPPYSYLWNDAGGQTTVSATGLEADSFNVVITDSLGCTITASIIITEPDVLVINEDTVIDVACKGDSTGSAIVSVTGGTRPYSYSWNTVPVQTDSIIDSLTTGNYTISVVDSLGCNLDLTVSISEPNQLVASVSSTTPILCYGDSTGEITIIASGGTVPYTYLWSPSGDSIANPTNLWAGMHIYAVIDSLGCYFEDTIQLTQSPVIDITISPDYIICEGASDTIQASAIGGTGILTYTWDNGLGSGQGPFVVFPDTFTYYHVIINDENGCLKLDSVSIMVFDLIDVVLSTTAPICVGDSTVVTATIIGGDSTHIYQWDFGDGGKDTTYGVGTSHVYNSIGSFNISLTVPGQASCVDDSLSAYSVVVMATPNAVFSANPAYTTTENSTIEFKNFSTSGKLAVDSLTTWLWFFGDGDTSQMMKPFHFYEDTGTYNVTLIVTNNLGCIDTTFATVRIDPHFNLEIPNAFTPDPNGPSGGVYDTTALDNNIFYPITRYVEEFHMQIFNRWGELIFESTDHSVGWDGYYREKQCQQDVYVWKIRIKWINGTEFSDIGDLTLVR